MFLLDVTLGAWIVLELSLRVRDLARHKGGGERDRATRVLVGLALGAALVLARVAVSNAPSLRIPGPYRAVGLIVIWLGLTLRVWAVVALGGAFRTTVEIDSGQAVISSGPYAWVRHPSYTGLILIMSGIGLVSGNWLAFAACVWLPLLGLVRRIQVEEAELNRVLGAPYRAYETRTKRLVPGIW